MNIQNDNTIDTLLRHSGLSLVQRHAHLSQTHLRDTLERVADYEKTNRKKKKPT